jgi:hypothetical protein
MSDTKIVDYPDISKDELTNAVKFMGTGQFTVAQFLHLISKNQDQCFLFPVSLSYSNFCSIGKVDLGGKSEILFNWNAYEDKLSLPLYDTEEELTSFIKDSCSDKYRFIVAFLRMESFSEDNNGFVFHRNVLIYDKEKKTFERFDPNGITNSIFNPDILDRKLGTLFSNMLGPLHYIRPNGICSTRGIQYVEEELRLKSGQPPLFKKGMCSVWSFVYLNYRLQFPNIAPNKIHDMLIKNVEKQSHEAVKLIVRFTRLYNRCKSARSDDELIKAIY